MAGGIKTLGNHGLAYLLEKVSPALGSGDKTEKGLWYYVTKVDSSASVLPVGVGYPFLSATALTLAAGDEVVQVTKSLLGFARGKSISQSKNVVDATTDSDAGIAQQLSDGIVATTGSISGYNEIPDANSAQEKIIQQFQTYARDIAGTVTVTEMKSEVMLLMIDWTARRIKASGPSEGDPCEIDVMPVIFTSKNTDSDYGSPKGFNVDFTMTSRDDDGFMPLHWVGKYYEHVPAE